MRKHKEQDKPKQVKSGGSKRMRYGALALAVTLLFLLGWGASALSGSYRLLVDKEPPEGLEPSPTPVQVFSGGAYNVLLMGTDLDNTRTDTVILAHIDLDKQTVDLLSLLRDTRVKLGRSFGKLNAVYGRDGVEGVIACVKEMPGAPIHYYALVDFAGFEKAVDALGGVEFDVPRDMHYSDPTQNLKIDLKKGQQHLTGAQALQLVRFRRYAEGDQQRARVQQDFLKALITQKASADTLLKLPDLFREMSGYVATNLTLGQLLAKLPAVRGISSGESVTTHELPGVAGYVGEVSYFLFDAKKTLALCEESFGGAGQPLGEILYTNDQGAQPMNPGGRPPAKQEQPAQQPTQGTDVQNPDAQDPDVQNPDAQDPDAQDPNVQDPNTQDPNTLDPGTQGTDAASDAQAQQPAQAPEGQGSETAPSQSFEGLTSDFWRG